MRALLVVNPKATATSARVRDVLARALGSDLKVDLAETRRRGHAIELGARATREGYDLVVAARGGYSVCTVARRGVLTLRHICVHAFEGLFLGLFGSTTS